MKKVGFLPYSWPFKWWEETNIAHNKIFSWALTEMVKAGGYECFVLADKMPFFTKSKISKYAKVISPSSSEAKKCESVIVFCGPYMPFSDKNSITYNTIEYLCDFSGVVSFVTCDYLLQFNFNIKRYGNLFSGKRENALVADKKWNYILHGGFSHHFRTDHQRNQILENVKKEDILEVQLNKSGIPLQGSFEINPSPAIDILYCGAFRSDRVEYFKKYFCSPQAKEWMISTTQEKKFQSLPGIKASIRGPYPGKVCDYINKSFGQILMTDKSDIRINTTPLPTRYWEALSAKSVVFCDADAVSWWDIKKEDLLVVNGAEELSKSIQDMKKNKNQREEIIFAQNKRASNFSPYNEWEIEKWTK
jgi:hypothetical protein